MKNLEKVTQELEKTRVKIEQLSQKEKELAEQKQQMEDMEYLRIIRAHSISASGLQALIAQGKADQRAILETREKERLQSEETL